MKHNMSPSVRPSIIKSRQQTCTRSIFITSSWPSIPWSNCHDWCDLTGHSQTVCSSNKATKTGESRHVTAVDYQYHLLFTKCMAGRTEGRGKARICRSQTTQSDHTVRPHSQTTQIVMFIVLFVAIKNGFSKHEILNVLNYITKS